MSLFLTNSGASLVLATGGIPVRYTSPLAAGVHPRLLMVPDGYGHAITPSDVVTRCTNGGPYADHFAAIVASLQSEWSSFSSMNNYALANRGPMVALVGMVGGSDGSVTLSSGSWSGVTQAQWRAQAVAISNRLVSLNQGAGGDGYSSEWAVTYDWTYNWMSSGERTAFASMLLGTLGWLNGTWATMTGIAAQEQIAVARCTMAIHGLATLGDPEANAATAATYYARYSTGVDSATDGLLQWENAFTHNEGGYTQGLDYGSAYHFGPEVMLHEAWRTAHGLTKSEYWSTGKEHLEYFPSWILRHLPNHGLPGYSTLGDDKFWPVDHSVFQIVRGWGATSYEVPKDCWAIAGLMSGVNTASAQLSAWLATHRMQDFDYAHYLQYPAAAYRVLFGPSNAVYDPQSPDTLGLPLSKYYPNVVATLRTGWDDGDTYVSHWQFSHWWAAGTGPCANGSFQVNRSGPLLIHRGSGVHDECFFRCTGNCPIIVNTTITNNPALTTNYHARGSQRSWFGENNGTMGLWPTLEHYLDEGGGNEVGTDFQRRLGNGTTRLMDFLSGDYSKSYNTPTNHDGATPVDRGCTQWLRSFIFARRRSATASDRIVVLDRITRTSSDYEVRVVLHPSANASLTVNGTPTAGTPDRIGSVGTNRRTTYAGMTTAEWTNEDFTGKGYQGRAFLTVLAPTVNVVKEGGPLLGGVSGDPYWLDGYGYPLSGNTEAGIGALKEYTAESLYQLELIAASPQSTDTFLYTLEIADSTVQDVGEQETTALLSSTGSLYAVRIGLDVFVLASTPSTAWTSGTITCPSLTGTWRVLLTGLSTANRTVTVSHGSLTLIDGTDVGSNVYTPSDAGESKGVLEFTLAVTAASTLTVS